MKRTTITLPDDVATALERERARHRTSTSAVVRQALTAYLGLGGPEPRPLPFANLGHSGQRHTARDVEEILEREWVNAIDS